MNYTVLAADNIAAFHLKRFYPETKILNSCISKGNQFLCIYQYYLALLICSSLVIYEGSSAYTDFNFLQ